MSCIFSPHGFTAFDLLRYKRKIIVVCSDFNKFINWVFFIICSLLSDGAIAITWYVVVVGAN